MSMIGLWAWDPVLNEWIKEPSSCPTKRLVAVGQAFLGLCRLHWVIINPLAPNAVLELTDDSAGGGVIHCDYFLADRNSLTFSYVPGMRFETGIYLETFTNLTSVVFGYTPDI